MRKIKKLLTVLFSLALVVGLVAAAGTYTSSVANAAEQTEATVDYGGAALRDDFFLIGVSTGDVSWTDQTASGRVSYADVKINGETQSVEVCYYGDDKLAYFIVPYALVPTDMTTSLIIPSGTVLDKIATKNELLYNLKGHSEIKTNVRRSNATFASGAPQDGNKRYLIYIETGAATADDAWTPNKFLLDGKEVTPNVANTGTEYFVCLDYSFFAENVTSHTQITDEHLFTIPAGTAIGSIVVENELNIYIAGSSIGVTSRYLKLGVTGMGARAKQGNRWYIGMTTDKETAASDYSSYGNAAVKVGSEDKSVEILSLDKGIVFFAPFDLISEDYTGKVTIPAGAKTSGGDAGYIEFTNEFTIALKSDGYIDEYALYTATLNFNGTKVTEVTFDVFDKEQKLAALKAAKETIPAVEHYEFVIENLPEELPMQDVAYEIKQVPVKYSVTFDGKNETKVAYGEKITKPEDPTKAQTEAIVYTFKGWYVGENEWNFEEDMVSGDTALVAKFNETVRKYKVTFDGGNETEAEYDTLLTKPEDPTKAATETTVYTFKSWFDGEKEWNFETDKVKKDTALVAKFDEADRLYVVTVKYTGVEKTDGEIKAKYNEKIDFIDFELDGYTYKVTKGGAEITELTVKGDDEITVTYEKKADPEPTESVESSSTESENPSESGNDSETNKPTGSESIKDSKTEEKSGCFGNVAGASAGVFAALIAAVAILRKRR